MELVIDEALCQVQLFRLEFLSNTQLAESLKSESRSGKAVVLKNQQQMYRVKSLVRMLNDCAGSSADAESSKSQVIKQTISADSKSLYSAMFEPKFIKATQAFYERQQQKQMRIFNVDKYIKSVDLIFDYEDYLIENYLDTLSFSLVNSCVYEYMIKNCHQELLNSGLPGLLNSRQYHSIILLYSYMHDTELLPQLKAAWSQYIHDRGVYYLKGLKPSRQSVMAVVGQIIDLKILTDTVINDCFQRNISLRNAQMQSFQEFCNKQGQQSKIAQIMSIYIDCFARRDYEAACLK